MPLTVEAIIERLGGPEQAARLTGVGTEAIRKWRQARAVPPKHWTAILQATNLVVSDLSLSPKPAESAMPDAPSRPHSAPAGATAALVLADGSVLWGRGFGAHSQAQSIGEICFSTGMTGYQETLTDASFAGQIITFTFPHIGNVGTTPEDEEAINIAARGLVVKEDLTEPSNWRATQTLDAWLKSRGIPGICGVDTRALTRRIRDKGPQTAILAYPADGGFDIPALQQTVRSWPGLEGMDLALEVSCTQSYAWTEGTWADGAQPKRPDATAKHVVAVDYGAKRNILRCLVQAGCRVTVVPANASAEDILAHAPDGVFLSNGPG
ncbi:MAG: carbamoyl phosphate synthase small subunit, partial [Janthinobacterium lividum]